MPDPTDDRENGEEDKGGIRMGEGNLALAVVGAVAGGVAGYFLFYWLARRGYVLLALPGAMVGIGRAALSHKKSWGVACLCGTAGLGLGLYIANAVFKDGVPALGWFEWTAVVVGAVVAFWFGLGRRR